MTLRDAHAAFAWFVVIGNGLAGAWALAAHRWPRLRHRALWWFTAVVQVAIGVQVALGAAVQNVDEIEPGEMHAFYGFVAIIAAAIVYAYKQQLKHRLHLLYGFGGLFLMGLSIRAMVLNR